MPETPPVQPSLLISSLHETVGLTCDEFAPDANFRFAVKVC